AGSAGSPFPDSALPSWIFTHHLPALSPLRSKAIVALVVPAFSGIRKLGIASTIWSGVIWVSDIVSSWRDRRVAEIHVSPVLAGGRKQVGGSASPISPEC